MTVRVWIAHADGEASFAPAPGCLTAAELERAERIGDPQRRRRFVARRVMARELLAAALGGNPGELVLERRCARCGGMHPASPLAGGGGEAWWSASSSGGLAALAIADRRVGFDLEADVEHPRWERIAARFFSAAERREVAGSPRRFLELWTLKEAYLKALGVGLPGGLRALECSDLTESAGWSASTAHPGWGFRNLDTTPGFVAALAIEGGPDSIELRRWNEEAGERDGA